jgi:hypothetical protein
MARPVQIDLGKLFRGLIAEQIGLSKEQRRARLLELGVDFGRGDLSEQVSLLDAIADIDPPALQIAGGPRIDGCLEQGMAIARQDALGRGGRRLRRHHRNPRQGR